MGTRVLMQPGLIRVSKPGQDVYTAAERDLLLSLSARSCQVIQRGFANFPPGTGSGVEGGLSVANFSVTVDFPDQQSAPDVWVALVRDQGGQGSNNNDSLVVYKAQHRLSFGSGDFSCWGRWQYTTAQYTSVFSLVYVVFRKRVTG